MRKLVITCLALIVVTFTVYLQVADHEFINFDVQTYVTSNPHVATGLTSSNVLWAFTAFEAGNWHPLTWLSHMTDVQLYGLNPAAHNLTNVALHALASVLLLLLLFRLTKAFWPSTCVAALFALHPLHVESVAWIAERKDVLSALFCFLTLLLYAGYVRNRKSGLYLLTLLSFMLGLMSKPMLVTLPAVMLLVDFWPLGRFAPKGDGAGPHPAKWSLLITEKLPFFACSLVSGIVTIYAQRSSGAVASVKTIPVLLRIENALVSYAKYVALTLWPHDLALLYPFPLSIPLWQVAGALLILVAISAAALRGRERYPYLLLGWLWFLVTLLPVSGLLQAGSQSMADRYSYIPSIGLFIMAAWGVSDLARRHRQGSAICAVLATLAITASAAATWRQLGYWRDSTTLYRRTLEVTSNNWLIRCNLGLTYALKGESEAALEQYRESLRINPSFPESHAGMGLVLAARGDIDGAIREYQESLKLKPDFKEARNNLGLALSHKGDLDAAIGEYQEALRISPEYLEAKNNLGIALARKGRLSEAIEEFQEVLRSSPNDAEAQANLNHALSLQAGQR
jgi:protein O-mannosyl-transferase